MIFEKYVLLIVLYQTIEKIKNILHDIHPPTRIKKCRNKKSSTSFWDEVKFLSLRNRAPQLAKPDQVYQQDNSSTRTQALEAFADTKPANLCTLSRTDKKLFVKKCLV